MPRCKEVLRVDMFNSIEDLMENCTSKFQMLIKFGNEKNLKSLQSGTIYMKNLKFYNELEQKDDSGKPDKYDGKWKIQDMSLTFTDRSGKMPPFHCYTESAVVSFSIDQYPIFCLFSLDKRNCMPFVVDRESQTGIVAVEFSDEQKSKMSKGLGDYALLITNTSEFISRITNRLNEDGVSYRFGLVDYNIGNSKERAEAIFHDPINIAFNKDEREFAYQQEYRLIITNHPVEDHYIFNVGDLSDLSMLMRTDDLLTNYAINIKQHYYPIPN